LLQIKLNDLWNVWPSFIAGAILGHSLIKETKSIVWTNGVVAKRYLKDAYDDIVSPINESVFQPFCVTGPFGTKKIEKKPR